MQHDIAKSTLRDKEYMKVLRKYLQLIYIKKVYSLTKQCQTDKRMTDGCVSIWQTKTVTDHQDHHLVTRILAQRCSNGSSPVTGARTISVMKIYCRAGMEGLPLFLHWQHMVLHKFSLWLNVQTALPFGNAHFIKRVWLAVGGGELLCRKKEVSAHFYSVLEETNLFYMVGVAEMVLAWGIQAAVN